MTKQLQIKRAYNVDALKDLQTISLTEGEPILVKYNQLQKKGGALVVGTDTDNAVFYDGNALEGGFVPWGYRDMAADITTTVVIGKNSSGYDHAVAIGSSALGNYNSCAIGSGAVSYVNGVALGASTNASDRCVALGLLSKSMGLETIAIGTNTTIFGDGGITIGANSITLKSNSISIGANTNTNAINSIAIGNGSKTTNMHSINMGHNNIANGDYSLAIGNDCVSTGLNSISIGHSSKSPENGVAIGALANATLPGGIAIGFSSIANGTHSISIGSGAYVSSQNSTAIGINSNANGENSTAIGDGAFTSGVQLDTIIIGGNGASQIGGHQAWTNLSDGRDKTDINPINHSLAFITSLEPIQYVDNTRNEYMEKTDDKDVIKLRSKYGIYDYNKNDYESGIKKGTRKRVGFKAQDIEESILNIYGTDNYADIVNDNFHDLTEPTPEGVESQKVMAYTKLIPFLVGAIKELKIQNDNLEKRINELT